MFSKRLPSLALLLSVSVFTAGCGLFGAKDDANGRIGGNLNTGCLNQLGPQAQAYLDGKANEKDWSAIWSCTNDAIGKFKDFVRGHGADRSLTAEDLSQFISDYLITNQEIHPRFVSSTLAIKATLFGGSATELSREDIARVQDFITALSEETTKLLPHFVKRKDDPSAENLAALSRAISGSGERLLKFFDNPDNADFTRKQLDEWVSELASTFKWNLPTEYIPALLGAKDLLLPGTLDVIHGYEWPRLLKIAFQLGGPAVAFFSKNEKFFDRPNEFGDLLFSLSKQIKATLEQSLLYNGDVFSYGKLFEVVDRLPESLTANRKILKEAFKTANEKLLRTRSDKGFDRNSLGTLFSFVEKWNRAQGHLERIFADGKLNENGVVDEDFASAAEDYVRERQYAAGGGTDSEEKAKEIERKEVYRLIDLVRTYNPLFVGQASEITFITNTSHSMHDLSLLHLFNQIGLHLLDCYGKGAGGNATISDLTELVRDFSELAFEFKIFDPTVKNIHLKRFREADLFTYASNGNNLLDPNEITYYLLMIKSSYSLASRIREKIEPICGNPQGELDNLGWRWMDFKCFREEYSKRIDEYWAHFPNLVTYYRNIPRSERDALMENMEKGFRRNGLSDDPIGGADIQSLAGYLHYIEAMFVRYDRDQNQVLDKDEALTAFPNFKGILSSISPGSSDKLLQSAFTYVLKYGKMPTGNLGKLIDFYLWHLRRPLWQLEADRGAVYSIVPILTAPN